MLSRVRVFGSAATLTMEQQQEVRQFLRSWYVDHVAFDSGRTGGDIGAATFLAECTMSSNRHFIIWLWLGQPAADWPLSQPAISAGGVS